MTEKLFHYSRKPLLKIHSKAQLKSDYEMKPQGFWITVGDAWKEWCESESFSLCNLRVKTEIVLHQTANILRLSNAKDIDDFTHQYKVVGHRVLGIRWDVVALGYDGVIISPYIWERRMTAHTFWYYPWDVASGCIWNASAVAALHAEEVCDG